MAACEILPIWMLQRLAQRSEIQIPDNFFPTDPPGAGEENVLPVRLGNLSFIIANRELYAYSLAPSPFPDEFLYNQTYTLPWYINKIVTNRDDNIRFEGIDESSTYEFFPGDAVALRTSNGILYIKLIRRVIGLYLSYDHNVQSVVTNTDGSPLRSSIIDRSNSMGLKITLEHVGSYVTVNSYYRLTIEQLDLQDGSGEPLQISVVLNFYISELEIVFKRKTYYRNLGIVGQRTDTRTENRVYDNPDRVTRAIVYGLRIKPLEYTQFLETGTTYPMELEEIKRFTNVFSERF